MDKKASGHSVRPAGRRVGKRTGRRARFASDRLVSAAKLKLTQSMSVGCLMETKGKMIMTADKRLFIFEFCRTIFSTTRLLCFSVTCSACRAVLRVPLPFVAFSLLSDSSLPFLASDFASQLPPLPPLSDSSIFSYPCDCAFFLLLFFVSTITPFSSTILLRPHFYSCHFFPFLVAV